MKNKCGLCPIDQEPNDATKTKLWGVYVCQKCIDKVKKVDTSPPRVLRDQRTEEQKEQGAKYWSDTLQPRRQGEPSREFIEYYPEEAKKIFTTEEILSSKNVWYDQKGAKSSNPSKGGDLSKVPTKALE